MKIKPCAFLATIAVITISLFVVGPLTHFVSAAEYPDRAVTLVAPFAPGGSMDVGARALAEAMEKHFKQPVVVVNKPGAGTTVGGNFVATSKPDGYTLGFLATTTILPELYSTFKVPYSKKDLKLISGVLDIPMAIFVKADAPWKSFKEMLEYARKNPGFKIADLGKNHVAYFVLRLLAKQEKINLVSVPFDGGSKIVPALLGGHAPAAICGMDPTFKSLVDSKKLRALVVCTKKRIEALPDVPSMEELGYKMPFVLITGVVGPKGLPEEVVSKINEVVGKIVPGNEFRSRMQNAALEAKYMNTETYDKTMTTYAQFLESFLKEEGLLPSK